MSLAGEKSPFLDLNLSLLSDSVSTSVGLDILDFDDVWDESVYGYDNVVWERDRCG
jgi:hypothetical protein